MTRLYSLALPMAEQSTLYGTAQLTVRDALNSALDEELARDDTVFLLGEEVRPQVYLLLMLVMHCQTSSLGSQSSVQTKSGQYLFRQCSGDKLCAGWRVPGRLQGEFLLRVFTLSALQSNHSGGPLRSVDRH